MRFSEWSPRWMDEYVEAAQHLVQARLDGPAPFLWAAESDLRLRKLKHGEIIVMPMSAETPFKIPNGLIHDWIGAAYFRGANLEEVLSIAQDYSRYQDFYRPFVIDSKLNSRVDERGVSQSLFTLLMLNHSLFARHALESDWEETYVRLDAQRAYSIEHRDGDVYVELEAIALSREVPAASGGSSIRSSGAFRAGPNNVSGRDPGCDRCRA